MMNKVANFILVIFLPLSLFGCASMDSNDRPPVVKDQEDPVVKALRNAPEIDTPEPLELKEYKNIEWLLVDNGRLFALTEENYKKLIELLKILENRIKIQRSTLIEVQDFYNEYLGREDVRGQDIESSSEISVEKQ